MRGCGVVTTNHDPTSEILGAGFDRKAVEVGCGKAEGGHAAVPPMVRLVTRIVGTPSPTGTPWPSFPQVPGGPMAKSSPSAGDFFRGRFGRAFGMLFNNPWQDVEVERIDTKVDIVMKRETMEPERCVEKK